MDKFIHQSPTFTTILMMLTVVMVMDEHLLINPQNKKCVTFSNVIELVKKYSFQQ